MCGMLIRQGKECMTTPVQYRDNFERFLTNLLGYLRDPQSAAAGVVAHPDTERESLALAIDDLCDTFRERF